MIRFLSLSLSGAALLALAGSALPADPESGARTITLSLTGSQGARFSGYYLRGGERVEVEGALPREIREVGISACEFRKASIGDTMVFEANDGALLLHFVAGPSHEGVRADLGTGWSVAGYGRALPWKMVAFIAIPVILLLLLTARVLSRIRRAKGPSSDEKMRAAARRLGEHLGKKPPE